MDALLILEGPDPARSRREIERRARITHEASPRVVVVAGDDAVLRQLAGLPGIVSEEPLAAGTMPAGLTPAEDLFVRAWLERRRLERTKQRRGEGLSWDTKGFEPP